LRSLAPGRQQAAVAPELPAQLRQQAKRSLETSAKALCVERAFELGERSTSVADESGSPHLLVRAEVEHVHTAEHNLRRALHGKRASYCPWCECAIAGGRRHKMRGAPPK
jgi:hypothetical protein